MEIERKTYIAAELALTQLLEAVKTMRREVELKRRAYVAAYIKEMGVSKIAANHKIKKEKELAEDEFDLTNLPKP